MFGKIRRRIKWTMRFVTFLIALGIVWVLFVQWKINFEAKSFVTSDHKDVAIVLGAALWSDRPSPALKERLDHAVELYREGLVPKLIVSGGLDGNSSKLTEAQGMSRYLVEQGIPQENIVEENLATSTYLNLVYSKQLMQENGWQSAYIVTHSYHASRAQNMANFIGMEQTIVSPTESKVMNMTRQKIRETLAYTKWEMNKWMMKLRLKER